MGVVVSSLNTKELAAITAYTDGLDALLSLNSKSLRKVFERLIMLKILEGPEVDMFVSQLTRISADER
jgi:hypothetical protein